jgi:hypothetical protein
MIADDDAVLVFEGDLQDAAFLVSLLESGGIATQLVAPYRIQPRIYVSTRDATDARACVADFESRRKSGELSYPTGGRQSFGAFLRDLKKAFRPASDA